jgi:hypothetical protein
MRIETTTRRRIAILDPFRVTDAATNFDPNSHLQRVIDRICDCSILQIRHSLLSANRRHK